MSIRNISLNIFKISDSLCSWWTWIYWSVVLYLSSLSQFTKRLDCSYLDWLRIFLGFVHDRSSIQSESTLRLMWISQRPLVEIPFLHYVSSFGIIKPRLSTFALADITSIVPDVVGGIMFALAIVNFVIFCRKKEEP